MAAFKGKYAAAVCFYCWKIKRQNMDVCKQRGLNSSRTTEDLQWSQTNCSPFRELGSSVVHPYYCVHLVSELKNNSHLVLADCDPNCKLIFLTDNWLGVDLLHLYLLEFHHMWSNHQEWTQGNLPLATRRENHRGASGWLLMISMVFSNWKMSCTVNVSGWTQDIGMKLFWVLHRKLDCMPTQLVFWDFIFSAIWPCTIAPPSHAACFCPTAGREAVLLPFPITAPPMLHRTLENAGFFSYHEFIES